MMDDGAESPSAGRPTWQARSERLHIERFNRTCREEVLDAHLFESLDQVRAISEAWLAIYNTGRPLESLSQVPPLTFLSRIETVPESTFAVSTRLGSLRSPSKNVYRSEIRHRTDYRGQHICRRRPVG